MTETLIKNSANNNTLLNDNLDNKDAIETYLWEFLISDDELSTNYRVDENTLNENRIKFLEERITPQLISIIQDDDFEFGRRSRSIDLVEEQIKINKIAVQNWFNKIFLDYFKGDEKLLLGLLRVVEYLDKDLFFPTGQTMAISALSHKSDEIKEMGVRIFENWGAIESYELLKNVKVDSKWLQEYINQVVKDLKDELCLI